MELPSPLKLSPDLRLSFRTLSYIVGIWFFEPATPQPHPTRIILCSGYLKGLWLCGLPKVLARWSTQAQPQSLAALFLSRLIKYSGFPGTYLKFQKQSPFDIRLFIQFPTYHYRSLHFTRMSLHFPSSSLPHTFRTPHRSTQNLPHQEKSLIT